MSKIKSKKTKNYKTIGELSKEVEALKAIIDSLTGGKF
jgi:cell division protein FtsB